jgi:hypothetical protein
VAGSQLFLILCASASVKDSTGWGCCCCSCARPIQVQSWGGRRLCLIQSERGRRDRGNATGQRRKKKVSPRRRYKKQEAKEGPWIVGDWGLGGGGVCPPAPLTCRRQARARRHRTCWQTTEAEEPVRETLCCAAWAVAWAVEDSGEGQGPLQRGEPSSVPASNQRSCTSFPRLQVSTLFAAVSAAANRPRPLELGLCAPKTIDRGQHKRRGFRWRNAHSRCSTEEQTLCGGPRGQRWIIGNDGSKSSVGRVVRLNFCLAMSDNGKKLDKRSDEQSQSRGT